MKNDIDGGEAIVEAFRQLGVRYIVSSPGSEWAPVWEALIRQKIQNISGPQYIQCWHETLAIDIAMGFTLITGEAQVVLLHAATGVLQGALGLFSATRAEIPMIVMSGESLTLGEDPELAVEAQWYGGVSVGGPDKLISSLVKWAGGVRSSVTLHRTIQRAGEMAARVPCGPVYLEVPLEHMLQAWSPSQQGSVPLPRAPKQYAGLDDVQRVARQLADAKNPVIVAEHSGRDPAAFFALRDLAEQLANPVIAAPGAAFCNFPSDHSLWLGIGSYQHLADADLVLLVGGRTPWYPPSKSVTSGKIIAVHDHPHKDWLIYQNLQASEYLEGNIAESLKMLVQQVGAMDLDTAKIEARRARWAAEHQRINSQLKSDRAEALTKERLSVRSICGIVAEVMPNDTIFVDETLSHSVPLRRHLPLTQPQSFFRHGGGLGQGIGMALGIKLAAPHRHTVLFVGDGSMLYNPIIAALGASRDYALPVLIVVLNNKSYASMKSGHEKHYPDGLASKTEFSFGVAIDSPPFEDFGRHFGFGGMRVETPAAFASALQRSVKELEAGRSSIINAIVD